MKTRIIVDSTADLVPEIKARVSTVPLTVHFGQEEYIDGVTIDNKTFYEKLVGCRQELDLLTKWRINHFYGRITIGRGAV